MLVTDADSLSPYHTGDLVSRLSSEASNISNGILNWLPNLIIYTFRFVSALAVVLYYDPTFALFALLGIPFSALLSRPLLRRMRNNNQKSAAMNAKMYGFNQVEYIGYLHLPDKEESIQMSLSMYFTGDIVYETEE